jgi:hypothetical protein
MAGDRLDHHRQGQMRGARVIMQPRARRPFRLEIAHLGAHARVVGPALAADIGGGKTRLVGRDVEQRDLALAVRGEFGEVVGDPIAERQRAFLDEAPDRRRGQHLGLREQQPQRIGAGVVSGKGMAVGPEEGELAVPRDCDLRAGIAPVVDVAADQPVEIGQRLFRQVELARGAGGQRKFARHR